MSAPGGLRRPHRERLEAAEAIAQLGRPTAGARRLTPDETRELLRRRAGVDALDGVVQVHGGSGARRHPDSHPIWAMSQLAEAWLLDRSAGGTLAWTGEPIPAEPAPTLAFAWSMAFGRTGAPPTTSGAFTLLLDDVPVLRFAVSATGPRRWRGEGVELCWWQVRTDVAPQGQTLTLDALLAGVGRVDDGYAVLLVDRERLPTGSPVGLAVAAEGGGSTEWVRIGRSRPLFVSDPHLEAIAAALRPPTPPRAGPRTLLRGDLHNHSGVSTFLAGLPAGQGAGEPCGEGTREELFDYARDVAGLDFFCLSEHDWQMDDAEWRTLVELSDRYDEPGRFVAVHGYEWTSATYGHRNVYFRDRPGPLFVSADPLAPQNTISADAPTPEALWAGLRQAGAPAMTVPHHMSSAFFPLSLDAFHDPQMDRVAEIYSTWGDSLGHDPAATSGNARLPGLAFRHAVAAGRRVGFIASSDSHDGHPGNAQGTARRSHLFHFLGSGLAAVWVDEPTRSGVFDALHARRCYAVTGGDAVVDLRVSDAPMGSVLTTSRTGPHPVIDLAVTASAGIASLTVYRDAQPVATLDGSGRSQGRWSWRDGTAVGDGPASYFVTVTMRDQEIAWTSPVWVEPR